MQRDAERARAAQIRAARQAEVNAERTRKAYERAALADEKERKLLYVEAPQARVDADNQELIESVERTRRIAGVCASDSTSHCVQSASSRLPAFRL
jgi:restriction system protein